MPARLLRYSLAVVAAYACLQAVFVVYQAHQFLVEPYSTVGTTFGGILVLALTATTALAILGRSGFQLAALVVSILAPLVFVAGIARMAGTPIQEAFKQAVCSSGVGVCFPQVAALIQVLPLLASIAVASLVVTHSSRTRRSGA